MGADEIGHPIIESTLGQLWIQGERVCNGCSLGQDRRTGTETEHQPQKHGY